MNFNFRILPTSLLEVFLDKITEQKLSEKYELLHEAEISTDTFSFYTSVASVYSSKIEGEDIELDSFIKHKKFGVEFLPDYTKKIDDLYDAYSFAKQNKLSRQNIEKAHAIICRHFIAEHQLGKIRNQIMYVITPDGKIEYIAANPYEVENELKKLFADIDDLLSTKLTTEEVFYFGAMIHLVFVKIHPFTDGNGRMARLLEKWFMASKLGENAWFIQSEKYYYENHQLYYNNLRELGLEYEELDYSKSLQFLHMLSQSL